MYTADDPLNVSDPTGTEAAPSGCSSSDPVAAARCEQQVLAQGQAKRGRQAVLDVVTAPVDFLVLNPLRELFSPNRSRWTGCSVPQYD